jgi:hypothetical protein
MPIEAAFLRQSAAIQPLEIQASDSGARIHLLSLAAGLLGLAMLFQSVGQEPPTTRKHLGSCFIWSPYHYLADERGAPDHLLAPPSTSARLLVPELRFHFD